MPLYLKAGKLLQVGGKLAVSADCCCKNNTTLCGSHQEACVDGIAPISILATISITDGGGGVCANCTTEANGTHVLTQSYAADQVTATAVTWPCIGDDVTYNYEGHCRWVWDAIHSFAPPGGACTLNSFGISVSLYKYSDGYRLFAVLDFRVDSTNYDKFIFRSAVIDATNPINCPIDLDGVVLDFVCTLDQEHKCDVTGGTITIGVP